MCTVIEGYCPLREEFLSSTDNATTFAPPIEITDNITGNPTDDPSGWYDTATIVQGSFYVAWAQKWSTAYAGGYWFFARGRAAATRSPTPRSPSPTCSLVQVSPCTTMTPASPAGFTWGIDLMGNLFGAVAPSTITVTGVPPLENVSWTVTIVAGSQYGYRYQSNETPSSPTEFTASTTIYENFTEQVLVQILTNPPGVECPTLGNQAYYVVCWNPPMSYYTHFSYDVYPFVGSQWLPYGVTVPLNASLANLCFSSGSCNIYTSWMNLSFQSWTGAGPGAPTPPSTRPRSRRSGR